MVKKMMMLKELRCEEFSVENGIFGEKYLYVLTSTYSLAKSNFVKEIEKEMNISFMDMINVIKFVNHWRGDLKVKVLSHNIHIGEYEECPIHPWWINDEDFIEMKPLKSHVRKFKNAVRAVANDDSLEIGEAEFHSFLEIIHNFGISLHRKIQDSMEL